MFGSFFVLFLTRKQKIVLIQDINSKSEKKMGLLYKILLLYFKWVRPFGGKACTAHDLTEIKCYPWLCSWLPGGDTFLRLPHFLSFGSCHLQIYIRVLIICLLRGGLSLDICQKFRSEFTSCTIAVCFKEIISVHPHRCQLDPYLSASVFMLYFKTEMEGKGRQNRLIDR